MSDFKTRLTAFLQQHGQLTSALTVQHTPGLLAQFVELTGNTVRMHLLARHMPYKQIIQLYTLVYATVEVGPISPMRYLFVCPCMQCKMLSPVYPGRGLVCLRLMWMQLCCL